MFVGAIFSIILSIPRTEGLVQSAALHINVCTQEVIQQSIGSNK